MKSILEFRSTKKEGVNPIYSQYEDSDNIEKVFLYDNFAEIGLQKDGNYNLIIERSEYITTDLNKLEEILWDWYKWQKNVSEKDMYDDLQNRAIDFLDEVDMSVSLDEFNDDEIALLSETQNNQRLYLVKEFSKI